MSWDRGVGRTSLVRLASWPQQSGSPNCTVCGQPVGVPPPLATPQKQAR